MRFQDPLVRGIFNERINRFRADVTVDGKQIPAHVPNSGRLRELLRPGAPVALQYCSSAQRATQYDLLLTRYCGKWVCIDSRLPSPLIQEAWGQHKLPEFSEYESLRREVTYKDSRYDLLLENDSSACLVELKSSNLVRSRTALFPDAPTTRGIKHVRGLIQANKDGYRAAVLFCIMRSDADHFQPNDEMDSEFGRVLRLAAATGVEVLAYKSSVTLRNMKVTEKVSVQL